MRFIYVRLAYPFQTVKMIALRIEQCGYGSDFDSDPINPIDGPKLRTVDISSKFPPSSDDTSSAIIVDPIMTATGACLHVKCVGFLHCNRV